MIYAVNNVKDVNNTNAQLPKEQDIKSSAPPNNKIMKYLNKPQNVYIKETLNTGGMIAAIGILLSAFIGTVYSVASSPNIYVVSITNSILYILSSESIKWINIKISPDIIIYIYIILFIIFITIAIIYMVKNFNLALIDIASSIIRGIVYTCTIYMINALTTK